MDNTACLKYKKSAVWVAHKDKEYGPFYFVSDLCCENDKPFFIAREKGGGSFRFTVWYGNESYGPFFGFARRIQFIEGKPFFLLKRVKRSQIVYGNKKSVRFEKLFSLDITESSIVATVLRHNEKQKITMDITPST